jgi:ankyrin repeat protein
VDVNPWWECLAGRSFLDGRRRKIVRSQQQRSSNEKEIRTTNDCDVTDSFPTHATNIGEGARVRSARKPGGYTLVDFCVPLGQLQMMRWLLLNGCDIDVRDGTGEVPLNYAMRRYPFAGFKPQLNRKGAVLVASGCDVEARNRDGDTPLVRAARTSSWLLLPLACQCDLKSDASGVTALDAALTAVLKAMLRRCGAGTGATDHAGLLFEAARTNVPEAVSMLHAMGHSLACRNATGDSLLHAAAVGAAAADTPWPRRTADMNATLRLLIDLGCDREATNAVGDTPLLTAVEAGNYKAAAYLARAGATTAATSRAGELLQRAARGGRAVRASLLACLCNAEALTLAVAQATADVAPLLRSCIAVSRTAQLVRALFAVIERSDAEQAVSLLHAMGCDFDVANAAGESPLAASVRVLRSRGPRFSHATGLHKQAKWTAASVLRRIPAVARGKLPVELNGVLHLVHNTLDDKDEVDADLI